MNIEFVSINFIPDYLEDYIEQGVELSGYDMRDVDLLTNMIMKCIGDRPFPCCNDDVETRNKLMDLYFHKGDIAFNDDNVTIDGHVAYKTKISVADNVATVNVICGKGSTNMLLANDKRLTTSITEWLLDSLFIRLGEALVVNTNLFNGYWLSLR